MARNDPFRPRCPGGEHAGLVPGKLFCTACGRQRDETDGEYAAAEVAKFDEDRLHELEAKVVALGGSLRSGERNLPFLEAYHRILVRASRDVDEPELDPSLN